MMLIMTAIDPLDARILLALDDDPEATTLALSRRLGIARNTVHARLRRIGATRLHWATPWSPSSPCRSPSRKALPQHKA